MTDTILYINHTNTIDTSGIPAVICENSVVAQHHKESCFATNTAVLIKNDVDAYKSLQIDGVYFTADTDVKLIKEIRKNIPDIQMGLDCQLSKHTAMLAGEAGVDFVTFSGGTAVVNEVVSWWAEMMEIPVVVRYIDGAKDRIVETADFVLLDD